MSNTPPGYAPTRFECSPNYCHRCEAFGDLFLIDQWQPVCADCARGAAFAARMDTMDKGARDLLVGALDAVTAKRAA